MPTVSVIICAYTEERWDELCSAVASVQAQILLPTEIILVIDHNPVLLQRAQAAFSGVITLENRESRGLSGARNSGIRAAHGDILAFMDEDAEATPEWLARLVRLYAKKRVIGVGGAIDPIFPERRPAWFPDEFDWVVGCTYRGLPQQAAPVRNLIGCNMSFLRQVFETTGGFRNGIGRIGKMPIGCEETEFCIRLAFAWPDSQLMFDPGARVAHKVARPRIQRSYFFQRCFAEGISKAQVTHFVGKSQGLASEWRYIRSVLPRGILRGLKDAWHGDLAGLVRAMMILSGLAITVAGYLKGLLLRQSEPPTHAYPQPTDFWEPVSYPAPTDLQIVHNAAGGLNGSNLKNQDRI